MESKRQKQVAGDNSTQMQAGTIINNNNNYYVMTEEQAREISRECKRQVLESCTAESVLVAQQRIEAFEEKVLMRIESIEKDFVSFSDPAFQVLYKKAQITAACSGRELDYGMLSELIAHRINHKNEIKKKASIEKAIEIIDKIDEDALCGLTMVHAVFNYIPADGNISKGLDVINNLYGKLQHLELPTNCASWIDNLDILGAVRIQSPTIFNKYLDLISKYWEGYVCCGIKKESEQYEEAINKLKNVGLSESLLVDNELFNGYVRIPVIEKENIDRLQLSGNVLVESDDTQASTALSDNQKAVLMEIFDSYDKTSTLISAVRENFNKKIQSYEWIRKAEIWWDQLKPYFQITSIGRAIAQANAKRIDPSLPDLD
ncbi:MAG: hypothetical protein J6Y74_02460 [Clostridia bacterium]|nr:hypothetical protein [Clostridia bacterium]